MASYKLPLVVAETSQSFRTVTRRYRRILEHAIHTTATSPIVKDD
jgi:hypothetical protein